LLVDTRYQREEIASAVNDLVIVLKRGGQIPDPISVVERKYGDRRRYIVDGQQRWWAHIDAQLPIRAVIYHVESYEDEVMLFHALNTQTRVTPHTRLLSWPGPAGRVLKAINEAEGSPLKGKVSFKAGGGVAVNAMAVLRGLTTLLTNSKIGGGLSAALSTFDRMYASNPKAAEAMMEPYVRLLADVFTDGKHPLKVVPAVALAKVMHAALRQGSPLPTTKQIQRLRVVNWDALMPTSSMKWLPTVLAAVFEIWPVSVVMESR
jgi:hypothetical protein